MRKKLWAVLLVSMLVGNVRAENETIKIAPQTMPAALHSLASQAGVSILFSAEELRGIQTKAISGAMSAEDALVRLLEGTGYTFYASGNGAYVIKSAPSLPKKRDSTEVHPLGEVVVSATRTANLLEKVAAAVSVATQEDFDEVQATSVSQVLKKLPNVDFGGGPRVDGEIPTIRGYSGHAISLLVDGARQNWANTTLRSPLYMDPYFIEKVEVLRGSASSLYGSGGNGGAMVFNTISARDFLSANETFGGGVKVGRASTDGSEHFNVRLYGQNEVVDGLIAFGRHDWGNIRQGRGTQLSPNDGDSTTGLLKLGVTTGTLRYELAHQQYNSQNRENNNPQADSALAGAPAVQLFHTAQKQTVLKAATTGASGGPMLSATLYNTELNIGGDQGVSAATAPRTLMRTNTFGGGLQGSLNIGSAATTLSHRLTAGLDYYKDKQSAISGSAPNSVIPDGTQQVSGFFVQDEISLSPSWSLTPSLRSDRYVTSAVSTGSSTSASRVSPKVVLAWQAADGFMLYGNYGEAFRAPNLNESYWNLSGTNYFNNFRPNPDLRPEVDKTFELGANLVRKSVFADGDKLKLRANVFDAKARDMISQVTIGTYVRTAPFAGTGSIFQYQNVTNAKRNGSEIESAYDLGKWRYGLGYSRLRVTDASNGKDLFSPPDKLSLQVRRQLPQEGVSIFWNTTGVAAQDYDATTLRQRPGYATHDLFLNWILVGQKFKFDIGVTNLSDKRYATYQSSNTYAYTYQEGRSLRASVSADF